MLLSSRSTEPDRASRRRGQLFGAKCLEGTLEGLESLQAFEIPQNRQRNLWKSLEKNSLVLEKLAKKLGGSGVAPGDWRCG
jgi:hypothetical protein